MSARMVKDNARRLRASAAGGVPKDSTCPVPLEKEGVYDGSALTLRKSLTETQEAIYGCRYRICSCVA